MTLDIGLHEVCVRVGGRAGVRYVITKFNRMDSLPNFLTHGAPLARFARESSAKTRSICYRQGCEPVVRSGARLLHTILPEKFEMWKLENAILGMFQKVLLCHGRTFIGIDLRSPRPQSGSRGGGVGCAGARTSPSLLPP